MTDYLYTISLHWHDGTLLEEDYVVDGQVILTAGTIAPNHYSRGFALLGMYDDGVVVSSDTPPSASEMSAKALALFDLIGDPSLREIRSTVAEYLGPELGAPGELIHYVISRR